MWFFKTDKGTIHIIPRNNRFHVVYDDEDLGSYINPQQACEDVAGGHTFEPSNEVEFDELDIPYDLSEWQKN